ncbi:MAG: hypothetical protein ABIA75_09845 [Candidatus Neomarinimicrobiota bacterium]
MKIPIRKRLALKWAQRNVHPAAELHRPLAFRSQGAGLTRVLVVFPEDQTYFRIAQFFLRTVLANPGMVVHVLGKTSLEALAWIRDQATVKTYAVEDFNWWGLPRPETLSRIYNQPYDAVVDLNPEFNLPSATLVWYSRAPLRVGFKSEYSYEFYNLEVDRKPESFIEQGYVNIQKILGL